MGLESPRERLSSALAKESEWLRLREIEEVLSELTCEERRVAAPAVLAACEDFRSHAFAARLLGGLAPLLPERDRAKPIAAAKSRIARIEDPDIQSRLWGEITCDKRELFFQA